MEQIGRFRIYEQEPTHKWPGFTVSWARAWLTGIYADRDAALVAAGYMLGGEAFGPLEHLWEAVKFAGRYAITVEDIEKFRDGH